MIASIVRLALIVPAGIAAVMASVEAAEVKVWAGGVVRPVLEAFRPDFERNSGHTLVIDYGSSPEFQRRLAEGKSFDVAILVPATIDAWIKSGTVAAGSRSNLARAGLGVAVKAGAAKPAVGTVAGLKDALLSSKSVAHSNEGPTRAQLMSLLERLGIAAQMAPKLKPLPGGGILKAVAEGQAELAVSPLPTIVSTPGIDNAGALPAELQSYLELTAGIATAAKEPAAGRALLDALFSPAGLAVIAAKGFERMP